MKESFLVLLASIVALIVLLGCISTSPSDDSRTSSSRAQPTSTPIPGLGVSLPEIQSLFIAEGYWFEPTRLEEIFVSDGENLIEPRTTGRFNIGNVEWGSLNLYGPPDELTSAHLDVSTIVLSEDTNTKPVLLGHLELLSDKIARKHWPEATDWILDEVSKLSNVKMEASIRKNGVRIDVAKFGNKWVNVSFYGAATP